METPSTVTPEKASTKIPAVTVSAATSALSYRPLSRRLPSPDRPVSRWEVRLRK